MLVFELSKEQPRRVWIANAGDVEYMILEHNGIAATVDERGTVRPYSAIALPPEGEHTVVGSYAVREMAVAACKRRERMHVSHLA